MGPDHYPDWDDGPQTREYWVRESTARRHPDVFGPPKPLEWWQSEHVQATRLIQSEKIHSDPEGNILWDASGKSCALHYPILEDVFTGRPCQTETGRQFVYDYARARANGRWWEVWRIFWQEKYDPKLHGVMDDCLICGQEKMMGQDKSVTPLQRAEQVVRDWYKIERIDTRTLPLSERIHREIVEATNSQIEHNRKLEAELSALRQAGTALPIAMIKGDHVALRVWNPNTQSWHEAPMINTAKAGD